MNCPKCGGAMRAGFLQTSGPIVAFNEKRHRISLNSKDPGDVMIFKKFMRSADFNGWMCEKCRLIVFDCKNPLTRW